MPWMKVTCGMVLLQKGGLLEIEVRVFPEIGDLCDLSTRAKAVPNRQSILPPDDARFDWERPRSLAGAAHVWKGIAIELKPRNRV